MLFKKKRIIDQLSGEEHHGFERLSEFQVRKRDYVAKVRTAEIAVTAAVQAQELFEDAKKQLGKVPKE